MTVPLVDEPAAIYKPWDDRALRLLLAHLEDDELTRDLHRELIYSETGMTDEQFYMADRLAWMHAIVISHRTNEVRELIYELLGQ